MYLILLFFFICFVIFVLILEKVKKLKNRRKAESNGFLYYFGIKKSLVFVKKHFENWKISLDCQSILHNYSTDDNLRWFITFGFSSPVSPMKPFFDSLSTMWRRKPLSFTEDWKKYLERNRVFILFQACEFYWTVAKWIEQTILCIGHLKGFPIRKIWF